MHLAQDHFLGNGIDLKIKVFSRVRVQKVQHAQESSVNEGVKTKRMSCPSSKKQFSLVLLQ
jgi:hypothetical protein